MKAIIVDDERLARAELKSLLKEYPSIEVIDEAQNAKEGLEKIEALKPDIVFMDIQMPDSTGIEVMKELKKLSDIPQVVFVTAYDEHAIEAFRLNALDYLMKPVDPKVLSETITKITQSDEEEEFTELHTNSREERRLSVEDFIFIKDGEKCFFLKLEDVRYFESMGNYVKVFFQKDKPMMLRSLNGLEERLSGEHFFRANRKFIMNLNHIVSVENWFNGGLQVTLSCGEKIEISRRQTIKFKEQFSL